MSTSNEQPGSGMAVEREDVSGRFTAYVFDSIGRKLECDVVHYDQYRAVQAGIYRRSEGMNIDGWTFVYDPAGKKQGGTEGFVTLSHWLRSLPNYFNSLPDAFALVEHAVKDGWFWMACNEIQGIKFILYASDKGTHFATAPSLPHAICNCFAKALALPGEWGS